MGFNVIEYLYIAAQYQQRSQPSSVPGPANCIGFIERRV